MEILNDDWTIEDKIKEAFKYWNLPDLIESEIRKSEWRTKNQIISSWYDDSSAGFDSNG
jgi:hypothetical protein